MTASEIIAVEESPAQLRCQGCGAPTNRLAVINFGGALIRTPKCNQHLPAGMVEEIQADQDAEAIQDGNDLGPWLGGTPMEEAI